MADGIVQIGMELVDGDKTAAAHAAVVDKVEGQTKELAGVVKAAAAEEEAQLRVVEAQYGQLGAAAAAAGEAAAAGAAAATVAAERLAVAVGAASEVEVAANGAASEAAAAREADARAFAAAEAARSRRSVEGEAAREKAIAAAAEAYQTAETVAERAFAQAQAGAKGAERSIALATIATEEFEVAIAAAEQAGGNTSVLEARLAAVRQKTDQATTALGRYRAAAADASDKVKVATAKSGEFEGQLGSLEAVLNTVSPSLGNLASKGVAIGGGIGIGVLAIQQLSEVVEKLGKKAADAYADSLSHEIDLSERLSGSSVRLAQNLKNILAKEGYDVAGLSLSRLLDLDQELAERLQARTAAAKRLADAIGGDAIALHDSTATLLQGLEKAREGHELNSKQAKRVLVELDAEIAKYEDIGRVAPVALLKARHALEAIARTAADVRAEHDKLLEAVGVKSAAAFFKGAEDIHRYVSELQIGGAATAEAGGLIVQYVDGLRAQLRLLPEDQRVAAQGILAGLEDIAKGYRETGEVALRAFGVQAPDAIQRSIESLIAYSKALTDSGAVTGAEGLKIIGAIKQVRDQIDQLPAAQRSAAAASLAALDKIETGYRDVAAVAQKEFGLSTPGEIQRSVESLQTLAESFGPLGHVSREQAEKVRDSALQIQGAIALLPPEQRAAVVDQIASLQRLVDKYGFAAQKQQAFARDTAAAFKEVTEIISASLDSFLQKVDEVKRASIAAGKGGDLEGLKKEVVDLQRASAGGLLTQDQQNRLNEVTDLLHDQGVAVSDLTDATGEQRTVNGQLVISQEAVDSSLHDLLGSLFQSRDAWNALGTDARASIESQVSALQEAGRSGFATEGYIRSAFAAINDVFTAAGQGTTDLSLRLAETTDGTLDLRSAFAALDYATAAAAGSQAGLGAAQDEGVKKQRDLAKAAREAKKEVNSLAEAHSAATKQIITDHGLIQGPIGETVSLLGQAVSRAVELSRVSFSDAAP